MATGAQFVNRSAQEHLLYIQEKVNPILEALVTAVLLERPEDPSHFMYKWLCEQTKSPDGTTAGANQSAAAGSSAGGAGNLEIETVRAEIAKLKERKAALLAKKGLPMSTDMPVKKEQSNSNIPARADEDDEEEEDDDDEDAPDLPLPPPLQKGPRQSVSAEAYGQWNQKRDFVAPEYPKTSEQQERIQTCLKKSFLFSGLDQDEMKTVILAFKEKIVEDDTRIINQGDDGESMFLIELGVVDCLKKAEGGEEKVVKTCTVGDVVGELALLYNCPRAASVHSRQKVTLWELDRETFNRIVKDAAAKKRTTYTEFLKKIPLFGNVDEYEMMSIADALKVEVFGVLDTCIITQGDVGDKFFIVLEGECVAKKSFVPGAEQKKVMTHKTGDYFGELSLLKNEPRAASVFSSTPVVKLLSMERRTFKRLLGPIEDILRREAKRYDIADEKSM